MSFAYLPLYTGDYLRDTRALSMAAHGCYLMLLMFCWDSRGPLPLEDEEIAAICGARSQEERATMAKVVEKYFTKMNDGHYNERIQREIERCNAISSVRSMSGQRGAIERMRKFREAQAIAKQMPSKSLASDANPIPIPIPIPSLPPQRQRPVASRLGPDWQLPDEWKAWAVKVHHLDPQKVVRISLAFRDYWISKPKDAAKLDWFATWRNWIRKEAQDA